MLPRKRIDCLLIMAEQLTRDEDISECWGHFGIDRESPASECQRAAEVTSLPRIDCQTIERPFALPVRSVARQLEEQSAPFRRTFRKLDEVRRITIWLSFAVDQLGRLGDELIEVSRVAHEPLTRLRAGAGRKRESVRSLD